MTNVDDPPSVPLLDSVAVFASDLRALRLGSGGATLAELAQATGVSKSVLSEAFAGRRVPSARTVAGIVRACDAMDSLRDWIRRRDELSTSKVPRNPGVASSPTRLTSPTRPPSPPVSGQRLIRRRTAVGIATAASLVGVLIGTVVHNLLP